MDTSSFDATITAATDKRDALLRQSEEACSSYIGGCQSFLQEHFRKMVEGAVTTQPDVTQTLGLNKLRELKAELNRLIESVPQIVSDNLDKPVVWAHRNPFPDGLNDKGRLSTAGYDFRQKVGDKAQGELREIFGHIGALLLKYGLASSGRDQEWEVRPNGLPRYKYGMSTSPEMGAAMKKYNELFSSSIDAHIQLLELEKKKEEAIAKDLWNQA